MWLVVQMASKRDGAALCDGDGGRSPSGSPRPFRKVPRRTESGGAEVRSAARPCVSFPLHHCNMRYSYAEAYNVTDWVCQDCSARFILLPTTQEARAVHGIVEVAVHEGNFHAWMVPQWCTCGVQWVSQVLVYG